MDSVEVKSRKAEQSEATRADLVKAARELFGQRGYRETSTEEIVQQARVTRGALYHHFLDKEELFKAVYEEVQRELIVKIMEAAANFELPWVERLQRGMHVFLDWYLDPAMRQIVLIDSPSVLDWQTKNEIHMRQGLGQLRTALQVAMDEGAIESQPAQVLAHVLHGALNEGSMAMARADDVRGARADIGAAIDRLLEGLRASPSA